MTWILALFLTSFSSFAGPNLINGQSVKSTEAPWVVKIEKDNVDWCSGTLIGTRWVLTAAHCFDEIEPSAFLVYGGGTGLKKDLKELPPVRQIIVHPKYYSLTTSPKYDIALMELHDSVKVSSTLKPVALLSTKELSLLRDELPVSIYGWGETDTSRKQPNELMKIELPLVKKKDLPALRKSGLLKTYPLWATEDFVVTMMKNKTTCNGDSGTGWIMNVKNVPHLIAVHSAGDRCMSMAIGNPVGAHFEWISEFTN